jgi:flagellar biogenesis protein FliO
MAISTNADLGQPSPAAPRSRWLLAGLGVIVVAIGLLLPHLGGASAVPETTPERTGGSEMGSMLLRLTGGTAFVLILCVAVLVLCRRWLGPASSALAGSGRFEILESLPLGSQCRVHLVRVGDRHMLAGMDGTGLKAMLQVESIADQAPVEAEVVGAASKGG